MRCAFEQTSRYVTQVANGTRLHVVEARRAADGTQRVCLRVVGDDAPIGWATARRADGTRTIREVRGPSPSSPRRVRDESNGVAACGGGGAGERGGATRSNAGASGRGASCRGASSGAPFASPPPAAARKKSVWTAERRTLLGGGALLASVRLSGEGRRASAEQMLQEPTGSAPGAVGGGGAGGGGAGGGGGGGSFKEDSFKKRSKVSQEAVSETRLRAAEVMAKDWLAKQHHKMLRAKELLADAAQLRSQAAALEDALDPKHKSLAVLTGEGLESKASKDLSREWDPNGDVRSRCQSLALP